MNMTTLRKFQLIKPLNNIQCDNGLDSNRVEVNESILNYNNFIEKYNQLVEDRKSKKNYIIPKYII